VRAKSSRVNKFSPFPGWAVAESRVGRARFAAEHGTGTCVMVDGQQAASPSSSGLEERF
jgi:hypothetical protein